MSKPPAEFFNQRDRHGLAILKPRSNASREESEAAYTEKGLEIIARIRIKNSDVIPERIYQDEHYGKSFYGDCQELWCNPGQEVWALIFKGDEGVTERIRNINGNNTVTFKANEGSIRERYGPHHKFRQLNAAAPPADLNPETGLTPRQEKICAAENCVHAPDSVENFCKDLGVLIKMVRKGEAELRGSKLVTLQGLIRNAELSK